MLQAQVASLVPIQAHITSASAVTIADGTNTQLFVPWFQVNENNGGTPTLTVAITDGTTTLYLGNTTGTMTTWKAKAVTANQSVLFDGGYSIPVGWKLQVTSSDASGHMDVIGLRTSGR